MNDNNTTINQLRFKCPSDLKDYYIAQISENRRLYDDNLKIQSDSEIEAEAADIFKELFKQGDIIEAHLQSNWYKNKWFNLSYRILVAWISMTYQLWEQQFRGFVINIIEASGAKSKYPESAIGCWKFIKKYSSKKIFYSYNKIDEMRLIVNAIKHAEGCSAIKLKKIRPDIFLLEKSHIDGEDVEGDLRIANSHQSIADRSLNLSDNDYYDYSNSLITFWNEMGDVEISIPVERQITQRTVKSIKSTDLPI